MPWRWRRRPPSAVYWGAQSIGGDSLTLHILKLVLFLQFVINDGILNEARPIICKAMEELFGLEIDAPFEPELHKHQDYGRGAELQAR